MIIKDTFTVEKPLETVWVFLLDIPRVSACLPGVEGVEEIEPGVYRARLKVKIGPIRAAFGGRVSVIEKVASERLVAWVEGHDKSSATMVRATFTADLEPIESGTRINCEMDVALRGRLAQFGTTVVKSTAKKMTTEFAKRMQDALAIGASG